MILAMPRIDTVFARLAALAAVLFIAQVAPAQFDKAFGADPFGGEDEPEIRVSVEADREAVVPGGELVVAVIIDHAPGFHTNLNEPVVPPEMEGFVPIATTVEVLTQAFEVGPMQWPEPHAVPVAFTGTAVDYLVYSERAVVFVPMRVDPGLAPEGRLRVEFEVTYQACDDVSCLPPETVKRTVEVRVGPADAASDPSTADPFDGFDASVFDRPWTGKAESAPGDQADASGVTGTFFGIPLPGGGGAWGLIGLSFLGAVGGLILNLTPCVLPVIPIKVMTLSRHAGENRAKALTLGLWMALGVVAFWAALALPVLTLQGFTDPSRVFGIWWLTVGIGLLIALMSLGLMGLFQITLPQSVYMVNPKADTAWGSFVFGVMTAILGLPCFGFVAGALVPAAITQGTAFVITLFTSMGVGMALPYLVLSVFPQLVDKLPRTGPASELVKQIMGLLLLAAAAYFVGSGLIALVATHPYLAKLLHIWTAALFGVAAGVWLVVKTFQISKKPANRAVFTMIALLMAGLGVLVAERFTADARHEHEVRRAALEEAASEGGVLTTAWNDYSPGLMARVLAEGRVVVLDFTAEWCINCKVLEKTVLGTEPVRSLLRADDTVMVKVDLTGKNPEGERALSELGRTGIPTLAVFGPGLSEPWVSSAYTPDQVVRAIERARGKAVTLSGG